LRLAEIGRREQKWAGVIVDLEYVLTVPPHDDDANVREALLSAWKALRQQFHRGGATVAVEIRLSNVTKYRNLVATIRLDGDAVVLPDRALDDSASQPAGAAAFSGSVLPGQHLLSLDLRYEDPDPPPGGPVKYRIQKLSAVDISYHPSTVFELTLVDRPGTALAFGGAEVELHTR
jgi:hypothetical protein